MVDAAPGEALLGEDETFAGLADEVVVDLCRELIASLRLDEGATGPGIMLVLGDSGGEPADTIQAEGLGRVTLHAFDEPMIGRLLEESFGLLEVPENFVRKLWQVSEGNPL